MAVTRKFLEAMGLDDAKISAIIEEHDKTVNGLKELRDKYKADADKLAEVQKKLDEATANNGDDWKSKYDTLKATFDDFKTETANREKTEKVKAAYTDLLKAANVDSKRIDAILKITDLSEKKLDENGKIVDSENELKSIRDEWGAFIQTTTTKGASVETPPETHSGAGMTKADIYAKDEHGRYKMSTAERQKALVENQIH
jgi:chromosome segregation ATPase